VFSPPGARVCLKCDCLPWCSAIAVVTSILFSWSVFGASLPSAVISCRDSLLSSHLDLHGLHKSTSRGVLVFIDLKSNTYIGFMQEGQILAISIGVVADWCQSSRTVEFLIDLFKLKSEAKCPSQDLQLK